MNKHLVYALLCINMSLFAMEPTQEQQIIRCSTILEIEHDDHLKFDSFVEHVLTTYVLDSKKPRGVMYYYYESFARNFLREKGIDCAAVSDKISEDQVKALCDEFYTHYLPTVKSKTNK